MIQWDSYCLGFKLIIDTIVPSVCSESREARLLEHEAYRERITGKEAFLQGGTLVALSNPKMLMMLLYRAILWKLCEPGMWTWFLTHRTKLSSTFPHWSCVSLDVPQSLVSVSFSSVNRPSTCRDGSTYMVGALNASLTVWHSLVKRAQKRCID